MKIVSYTDKEGRKWATQLPDDAPDGDAAKGLLLGPPSLESLGLPLETEVRLHNQLFERKLFTLRAAKASRESVVAAVMKALRVDAQKVIDLFVESAVEPADGEKSEGGKTPSE